MATGGRRRATRAAYSLIEILLGAGLFAAVVLRIYQSFAATSASDRYDAFLEQMNVIYSVSQQQYLASNTFAGISVTQIAAVLPNSAIDVSGGSPQLRSVYHTDIAVSSVGIMSGTTTIAGGGLEIDVAVPQESCTRLVSNAHELMDYVSVDGTLYDQASGVSAAITACGGTSTTTTVPIKIYYTGRLPLAS